VSVPWELLAIDRIWYYSPQVLWGARVLGLPIEELAFFAINGLLVGTLALLLERGITGPAGTSASHAPPTGMAAPRGEGAPEESS
jgi:hypothetical protein